MSWKPKTGDIFRRKGTEKPLYRLCGKTNYIYYRFVQITESGLAGGELNMFDLCKNYELVERPKTIDTMFKKQLDTETNELTRFERFGNVMIDLETLSTHTNAAIIEIGAVEFNKYTGEVGEKFNVIINPKDWCKNNRHVDGETIQWWFKQTNEARKRFITKQYDVTYLDLKPALNALKYFLKECDSVDSDKDVVVWGNGATMDITILESAYEYFNMETPWKFWSVNDVRTIVDLNPTIKKNCKFEEGVKHSAVADCLHEIKYTVETIKSLNLGHNDN